MKILCVLVLIMTIMLIGSCEEDNNPVVVEPELHPPDGMVLIPSKDQSFQMGSGRFPDTFPDEQPIHTVSFTHDFWMDTTEVTQSDYDSIMSAYHAEYVSPNWFETFGLGGNYPAYDVYWGDAVLYCNARSRRDGLDTVYIFTAINGIPGSQSGLEGVVADFSKNGYRLPTEAEWEYACRAGSESDFYWGKNNDPYPATPEDSVEFGENAVWYGNSWIHGVDSPEYGTHPVGTKTPNGFGLYNMAGNLYEWIHDWYDDYPAGAVSDPRGPDEGAWHFVRGGSWGNYSEYLRSSNRTFDNPGYIYYFIGFRVVRATN